MSSINPIISGFAPDPSLVRVGEWCYLVNSSFHMFPGLPIYASQDLLAWKHIGNGIHRQGQLSLINSDTTLHTHSNGEVMLATGGLYAPTIRHHEGVFYIVCTNVLHLKNSTGGAEERTENFIISTTDIWSNVWSDPVLFEFKGIDPSIFFNDDRVYIQGSQGPGPWTKIRQFELDQTTGQILSVERTLWTGTGGIYPEGPHIYKRRGWYYLMISEGGTHENHMVTMARSQNIWGPYEPNPHNPVLTSRASDRYIQYTGHCDIFEDKAGQWWGVCLGARIDNKGRCIMGRETFLTRGNWDGDWLTLEPVMPTLVECIQREGNGIQIATSAIELLYIRDPDLSKYRLAHDTSAGALTASSADLSDPEYSPTFVGKRQRTLSGRSSVTIHQGPDTWAASKVKTGIACYKDEHRYARIYYDASTSAVVLELVNKAKGISRMKSHDIELFDTMTLQIAYTEQECQFIYRAGRSPSGHFIALGAVDTLDMTNHDFVGPTIGIFAVAGEDGPVVEFSGLAIE